MWEKILELAIGDGLWALLFCALLIYQLKDSKAREVKYQSAISTLSQDLGYVKELDESIEEMERTMRAYAESFVKEVVEGGGCADDFNGDCNALSADVHKEKL